MTPPKILIAGHARHGKDTACEILSNYFQFSFESSSYAAARIFLFNKLKEEFGYKTIEECHADRLNHRARWFDEIEAYNTPDETRLARRILEDNDAYNGMRRFEELEACKRKNLFDLVVWVDAMERVGPEGSSSLTIKKSQADIIVDNNGPKEDFEMKVLRLGAQLFEVKGPRDWKV